MTSQVAPPQKKVVDSSTKTIGSCLNIIPEEKGFPILPGAGPDPGGGGGMPP